LKSATHYQRGQFSGILKHMVNQQISKIFNEIADILEIKGENPFRIRAYRRAAQNIEGLSKDVSDLSPDDLKKIPGIGQDLAEKIREFVDTGRLGFYEEIKKDIPEGLINLLNIPGLGPRTAKLLFEKLHITDIDELERYAREGRLSGLPGIRTKTEQNILKGIEMLKRHSGRFPIGKVMPIAQDIIERLKKDAPVKKLSVAGSLRRWKETIKDIDILATSSSPEKVMNLFVNLPHVKEVLMKGQTKSSIITEEGIQVDLRVVSEDSFGAALAYFTGSKAHNIRIREIAMKRGLKVNEYGIFDVKTNKRVGGKEEEDIYKVLDLPYIPPEMREDTGEIEAAMENNLPVLVTMDDLKGDLHVHSKYSDGNHDLMELAEMAKKRGYEYLAITDHSKGLGIAGGLQIDDLLEQAKQIRALNKKLKGIKLLAGVEIDIRSDCTLDYPDEVLSKLDIVVASIHSGFRQSKEKMTSRIVSAMKNPYVHIIAHPTGRLIGERDAYELDMDEILNTARQTGTALEINAYPQRLDLNDIYIKRAKDMGIPLVISTDAHIEHQLDFITYGIGMARRGWLDKSFVLNTLPYKSLLKHLSAKKSNL